MKVKPPEAIAKPFIALMIEDKFFGARALLCTLVPIAIGYLTRLLVMPSDTTAAVFPDQVYSYPPFAGLLTFGLLLFLIRTVRRSQGIIGH